LRELSIELGQLDLGPWTVKDVLAGNEDRERSHKRDNERAADNSILSAKLP